MTQDRDSVETNFENCARAAGILFITATAATMLSQILVEPFLQAPDAVSRVTEYPNLFDMSALLEIANALASAGITFALYPILRFCVESFAVAYAGLRVIEAVLGIVATVGPLLLNVLGTEEVPLIIAGHDVSFLLLLLVFTIGTMVVYPLLFIFRLVPRWLSLWGLVGEVMLFILVLMILFGRSSKLAISCARSLMPCDMYWRGMAKSLPSSRTPRTKRCVCGWAVSYRNGQSRPNRASFRGHLPCARQAH